MRYTVLPGTDLRVSVIAMGCWALAGDSTWGEQSEADSVAATRAALDAGINFFDTAPGYGDGLSERRLGKGLQGLRDRAVVATKLGPEALRPARRHLSWGGRGAARSRARAPLRSRPSPDAPHRGWLRARDVRGAGAH